MNLNQSLLNLLKDPAMDSQSVAGKKNFNLDFKGKQSDKKNTLNLMNNYTNKSKLEDSQIENIDNFKKTTKNELLLLLRII